MTNYPSFLIFCCYFTGLKAREINRQNMRNSKNVHIVFGTMQWLMRIDEFLVILELLEALSFNPNRLKLMDHEITLKILEFILNSKEKVRPGCFTFLSVYVSWIERDKILIHSYHLQNSDILHTRMDQRVPIKTNFGNFQIRKWVS